MLFDAPSDLFSQATVTREAINFGRERIDIEELRSIADGRWESILQSITGFDDSYFSGKAGPCPLCGTGRDRWQMFDVPSGACRCRQCGRKEADGFGVIQWLLNRSASDFHRTLKDVADAVGYDVARKSFPPPQKPARRQSEGRASAAAIPDDVANLRHEVYHALSQCFGLSEMDRRQIEERGLSVSEIAEAGYWSLPSRNQRVLKLMQFRKEFANRRKDVAERVPGVFPGGNMTIAGNDSAVMIPTRDLQGRIVGLRSYSRNRAAKYKWLSSRFAKGPSPGTPCHHSKFATWSTGDAVRITEGEFKADIATAKTGVATVSIPGVECWKSVLPTLEASKPAKILIAFDSDATTNRDVARNLADMWDTLSTLPWSPSVFIEKWSSDHKGIDDAIAAAAPVQELGSQQSTEYLEELRSIHGIDAKTPTLDELLEDLREHEDPFDPNRLARINLATYERNFDGRLAYWQSDFYRYKQGGWRKIPEDELNAKVRSSVNIELVKIAQAQQEIEDAKEKPKKVQKRSISNSMVSNVLAELRHLTLLSNSRVEMPCLLSDPLSGRYLLSLDNGLLDLDRVIAGEPPAECFSEHTSDWFSTTKLGYSFDGSADCSRLFEYLATALPDDSSQKLVQEFAGYLLIPANPFQRFLACEGDGGTGKSVLLSGILTAMLDKRNVSSVKLDGFGGNQFSLIDTLGKAANIDPDANASAKFNEGLFKQYSIGERMQFEAKGAQPFAATPTAKVLLGWNNRPRIRDATDGLWRRMLLVGFEHKVPPDSRIAGMDRPDWWDREGQLPGILNWALEGLRRLFDQGGFTVSQAMAERMAEYRKSQDPLSAFIDELVTYEPSASPTIKTSSLVAAYRHWAANNTSEADGLAMSARRMNAAIAQRFGVKSEAHRFGSVTARGFRGIQVHDYEPESEEKNFF